MPQHQAPKAELPTRDLSDPDDKKRAHVDAALHHAAWYAGHQGMHEMDKHLPQKMKKSLEPGMSYQDLAKAKIYDFQSKRLVADLPSVETPKRGIGTKTDRPVNFVPQERSPKEAIDFLRLRFKGHDALSFIDTHQWHGHDEPYVGGDATNIMWRKHEGDSNPKTGHKPRWNEPHPFPVHPDKVNHGGTLGKRVATGGGEPFPWIDLKYGVSKQILKDNKDKDLTIHTRSDLIAHDDYMKHLTPGKHKIKMHVMADNDRLSRQLEPGAPSVARRMAAAKKLRDAGHDVTIVHDQVEGIHGHPSADLLVGKHNEEFGEFKREVNQVKTTAKGKARIKRALGGTIDEAFPQSHGPRLVKAILQAKSDLLKAKIYDLKTKEKLADLPSTQTPKEGVPVVRDGKKEIETKTYVKEKFKPTKPNRTKQGDGDVEKKDDNQPLCENCGGSVEVVGDSQTCAKCAQPLRKAVYSMTSGKRIDKDLDESDL